MRIVPRAKQAVKVGALLLLGLPALLGVGCSSKTEERSSADPNAAQRSAAEPGGNAGIQTQTKQAPYPPGATGTTADTFVKPGG